MDSTGIATFGVLVDEGAELPSDLGEHLLGRQGITDPFEDPALEHGSPAWDERTDGWYALRRKTEEEAPIEIVTHSCPDVPMCIVALRGTTTSAGFGEPQELVIPVIEPARIAEAARFCEENEIYPFEDPKWILTAYLG